MKTLAFSFFLFSSLTCLAATNAEFFDAITNSNVEQVEQLIKSTKLSQESKNNYLDLANQIITQRTNELTIDWIKPYLTLSMTCNTFCFGWHISNLRELWDSIGRGLALVDKGVLQKSELTDSFISLGVKVFALAMHASGIYIITIEASRVQENNKTAFKNALKIKQLLLIA